MSLSPKHGGFINLIKNWRSTIKMFNPGRSSSIFAPFNHTTFGQAQTGATVPLRAHYDKSSSHTRWPEKS
jgi:hypothetical protein